MRPVRLLSLPCLPSLSHTLVSLTSSAYCVVMDDTAVDDEQWPGEWMRGVLSLCVLKVVAEQETYGYAVAQRLQAAGLGAVKGGTLYPALTRLEQDGLLTASWHAGVGGPGRKFFTATPAGHEALRARSSRWLTFTERATGLLTSERVTT